MQIKELSEKSGLSKDTIRYYERFGLLKVTLQNRQTNNYKDYTELHLRRLILIKHAKRMGVTLRQIKTNIQGWEDGTLSYDEKMNIFQQQLTHINQQIEELSSLKQYVQNKVRMLESGSDFEVTV